MRSKLLLASRVLVACLLVPTTPGALHPEELPWSLELAFADPPPAGSTTVPGPAEPVAAAQEAQDAPPGKEERPLVEGWRVGLTAFVLAAGMHGEVGAGPVSADLDVSFDELIDHFQMGAMGHVEVGYDRFGLLVDTIYMNLEDEIQRGPAEIDWRLEQFVLGFMGSFRLGPFHLMPGKDGEKERTLRLRLLPELLAGGRYVYLKTRINPELLNGESVSKDWLDPVVGARLLLDVTRRIAIIVRGDIGGFGAASDLTWSAVGSVSFRIARNFSIEAGYAALDYDFDDGDFRYNVMSRGPLLGFTFDF